jgi:hypothetical protein
MALKQVRRETLLLAAIIVLVTLFALPTITYPLGRDQGGFATIGRGIASGRTIYLDIWDIKPPATFYVYAVAISLFGRTSEAIRAIDLLIYPPIALGLYFMGKRIASANIGLWAALLFGVFYFTETFWTLTQSDGIVLLPMVLAFAAALKAADAAKGSALWAFASGVLCACAIWFKYPFALFIGAAVFAYWWARRANAAPLRSRDVLAFAAGGLLVGLVGILHLMAIGAWDALLQSISLTAGYTSLGNEDFRETISMALDFRWQHWGALFLMALLALVFGVRRFNLSSKWWIIIIWLLMAAAILLLQLKLFDYHWLPLLPPLALIGAGALEGVIEIIKGALQTNGARSDIEGKNLRGRSVERPYENYVRGLVALLLLGAMGVTIGARTLPYLTGQQDKMAYYHQFQGGELVADESLVLVNFLRERVIPGDSLFIWGFRPEVYYLSGLNPAVRFIGHYATVSSWYPPEWKQEQVDILWAALPPYVLVLQGDYLPWATGSNEDSNTLLQAYTELNNWLEFNYERDTQIGNFFIWRRISTPRS